jgi:hypothetical protein
MSISFGTKFYCVLDLEAFYGRGEITELGAILFTSEFVRVSVIQLFNRPIFPSSDDIDGYLSQKYPSDSIIKFKKSAHPFLKNVYRFQKWLNYHKANADNTIIFTCGNWDLGRKIPIEFRRYRLDINRHPIFHRFINVKDLFTDTDASHELIKSGLPVTMMTMLRYLNIKHIGIHHIGYDDVINIGNILIDIARISCGSLDLEKYIKYVNCKKNYHLQKKEQMRDYFESGRHRYFPSLSDMSFGTLREYKCCVFR